MNLHYSKKLFEIQKSGKKQLNETTYKIDDNKNIKFKTRK